MTTLAKRIQDKLTKGKDQRDARHKRACEQAKRLPEEKRTEVLRLLREVREQHG